MAARQPGHRVYGVPDIRPPLFLQRIVLEEMRHFVACVQGREQPLMQPDAPRRAVALAEAA